MKSGTGCQSRVWRCSRRLHRSFGTELRWPYRFGPLGYRFDFPKRLTVRSRDCDSFVELPIFCGGFSPNIRELDSRGSEFGHPAKQPCSSSDPNISYCASLKKRLPGSLSSAGLWAPSCCALFSRAASYPECRKWWLSFRSKGKSNCWVSLKVKTNEWIKS